ncbi:MAG TPA: type I-A CRISPR-associated protein Cas7/Csa2 [Euryarchaeota archaeon]|nr:type I-A CRISPR-associated protein Cas7/Csa2 [Euryarchaeota archaeon]
MFVSLGIRFEALVEALNMSETVGNYSRHRRVPYIIKDEDGSYRSVYVPAISGESIAHAYQVLLAEEAIKDGLKVCEECRRGEFFKSMNRNLARRKGVVDGDDFKVTERKIVENCVVEDIGGFLLAEGNPVKRTSAFQVSYALPIKRAVMASVVDPQLHARHSIAPEAREGSREGASEQMIYYVEIGTAIYGLVFNIDLAAIGVSAYGDKILSDNEIKKRQVVALKALLRMLSSKQLGAKLSRFFPHEEIKTMFATVSEKPFTVSSPLEDTFIQETLRRAKVIEEKFGEKIAIYGFSKEFDLPEEVVKLETPEEVILEILKHVEE